MDDSRSRPAPVRRQLAPPAARRVGLPAVADLTGPHCRLDGDTHRWAAPPAERRDPDPPDRACRPLWRRWLRTEPHRPVTRRLGDLVSTLGGPISELSGSIT